jgi:hypothetical protein
MASYHQVTISDETGQHMGARQHQPWAFLLASIVSAPTRTEFHEKVP